MADNEDNKGAMKVDVGLVRQLAELLDPTQLTEIEGEAQALDDLADALGVERGLF